MTSMKMRDPRTGELLTPHNAALIIIDVQPVQVASLATMEKRALVQNVKSLAEIAKLYGLPTTLSTVNVETGLNKPRSHQVTDVLGDIPIYDRTTLNAWEDVEFLAAVKATGRKKLIISALWTEVYLAFPTLDALRDGFDVYPVVVPVGAPRKRRIALGSSASRRQEQGQSAGSPSSASCNAIGGAPRRGKDSRRSSSRSKATEPHDGRVRTTALAAEHRLIVSIERRRRPSALAAAPSSSRADSARP